MEAKEFIGLDVGQKHTGLARASSAAKIAKPLKSLPTAKVIDELRQIIQKNDVEAVIIGLPRNLNGDDTAQTKWVREWVEKSRAQIPAPLFWADEALTSNNNGGSDDEHAAAAAAILQDFLDTPDGERLEA